MEQGVGCVIGLGDASFCAILSYPSFWEHNGIFCAPKKVKKDLLTHVDDAKQWHVLDPTQFGGPSHYMTLYPHVIPTYLCPTTEQVEAIL